MDSVAEFALRASALQARLLLGVHGCALLLVLLIPLAVTVRLTLLVVLAAALASAWRQRVKARAVELIGKRNERWFVRRSDGDVPIAACEVDYLSRWLVVLTLREAAGGVHRLAIFSDALSPPDFRRLRVLLRRQHSARRVSRRR